MTDDERALRAMLRVVTGGSVAWDDDEPELEPDEPRPSAASLAEARAAWARAAQQHAALRETEEPEETEP